MGWKLCFRHGNLYIYFRHHLFFQQVIGKKRAPRSIFWDETDVISFLGWTSNFGPTGSLTQHKIIYFFDINMVFANYLSMAYRLICIFGGYEFTFFKKPKYFYLFVASMFIINHTLVFFPIFLNQFSNRYEFYLHVYVMPLQMYLHKKYKIRFI